MSFFTRFAKSDEVALKEDEDAFWLAKHDFSEDKRKEAAKSGVAMSDGSFPIYSEKDVHNAINLMGVSKHPKDEVKAHIKARAKAVGAEGALPDDWKG